MTADEADEGRLLEGEDPATTDPETAAHWLKVYAELLGFKDRLVKEAENETEALSESSQEEALRDLSLLDEEKRRLANRYVYWRDRLTELRA